MSYLLPRTSPVLQLVSSFALNLISQQFLRRHPFPVRVRAISKLDIALPQMRQNGADSRADLLPPIVELVRLLRLWCDGRS